MNNTSTNTANRFEVLAHRVSEVERSLKTLAKRAARLGLPAPRIEKGIAYTVRTEDERGVHFVTRVPVTLLGATAIKVAGYEFLAALDHMSTGNVIRALVEGIDLAAYRDVPGNCAHCNTRRARKSTFLLRNEKTGEVVQVGSTCIIDFLGHDAASACTRAEFERDVRAGLGEFEGDSFGNARSQGVDLVTFLAVVAAVIRKSGWVSRRDVRENNAGSSTSELAFKFLAHPPDMRAARGLADLEPARTDFDLGAAALEFAQGIEPRSDFDHNLRTIAREGFATWKQTGIAAYIVKAYENELNRRARVAAEEARRNAPGRNPVHVGTIGKRETFANVTLVRSSTFEGMYGVSTLHVFETADGSEIAWFKSGSGTLVERGATCTIKATIKSHGERNGTPQTKVTRVAFA